MNKIFTYVEDYIEFIAGWRDRYGIACQLFENIPSPLSLARYDVSILNSLGVQTALENRPYTDKQAELAKKIVFKYRRQLASLPTPVIVPEKLDKFRLGIRQVDRTRSASVQDGVIWLRFPFDTDLIKNVKDFARESQGSLHWDSKDKVWKMAITEYNVGLVMTFFKNQEFAIESEIEQLFEKILDCEKSEYRIELVRSGDKYKITNAEPSLTDFLEQKLGDNCWHDLIKLCDYSEVCGYDIADELVEQLDFVVKKEVVQQLIYYRTFGVALEEIEDAMTYARLVNRLPLHYYTSEPLPIKNTDEIIYLSSTSRLPADYKINLLVTESSIMIGNRKQQWLQNAEKIIELI